MPTIFSHPAVPLALGFGLGKKFIPTRLLLAGVMASILPDFDVVAFSLGIPYEDEFGHRGFSHSFFSPLLSRCLAHAGIVGYTAVLASLSGFYFFPQLLMESSTRSRTAGLASHFSGHGPMNAISYGIR